MSNIISKGLEFFSKITIYAKKKKEKKDDVGVVVPLQFVIQVIKPQNQIKRNQQTSPNGA